MLPPITVFYHVYIHPAETQLCYLWPLWVDEQLGALITAGLGEHVQVKVCVVMPTQYRLTHLERNFQEVVVEYIETRYPFAQVVDVRDIYGHNIYEGQSLLKVHEHAQTNDGLVFYFHTKGITKINSPNIHDWRRYLQHCLITRWRECVRLLETNDVVSVKTVSLHNFWWARCDHLRRLANPIMSSTYCSNPELWENGHAYRYAFELWALTQTQPWYIETSNILHYGEFHPPSLY